MNVIAMSGMGTDLQSQRLVGALAAHGYFGPCTECDAILDKAVDRVFALTQRGAAAAMQQNIRVGYKPVDLRSIVQRRPCCNLQQAITPLQPWLIVLPDQRADENIIAVN